MTKLASVTEMANVRLAESIAERRIAIGAWLANLGNLISTHSFAMDGAEDIDTRAVVVVAIDDHLGPVVTWTGPLELSDLEDSWMALREVVVGYSIQGAKHPDVAATVRESWQRRRKERLDQATRQAELLAAHPWECEFCAGRFKTRRGAVQHERTCRRNPTRRQRRGLR